MRTSAYFESLLSASQWLNGFEPMPPGGIGIECRVREALLIRGELAEARDDRDPTIAHEAPRSLE